jgi:zinc protease
VGDYPVDSLVALIKGRFGTLRAPVKPRPRLDAPIPVIPGTRISIVADPELSTEDISLQIRRPTTNYRTEADHRHQLINQLFAMISGERFTELQRRPETPFAWAFLGPSSLIRNIETTQLSVTPKSGKAAESFEAALRELRRFEVHGVLPAELERAKAAVLSNDQQLAANEASGKRSSGGLVGTYVRAFTSGAVPVSSPDEYKLDKRLLPTITVAEVNAAIKAAARGADRFVGVEAPSGAADKLPTRAQLLAIIARADTATVAPWTEKTIAGDLVPNPPAGGRIVAERIDTALGLTDWRLSNGVRVLVKPTTFKADEIKMTAHSPGGLSLLSDADAFQGQFATLIVDQSGYGGFDTPALQKRLAGKIVSVSPDISETGQGFSGETTPKDLGTFFELLWLEATAPRIDSTAIAALREQFRTVLAQRDRVPSSAFSDTIVITLGHNSPRLQPLTLARAETLNPARGLQIYRDRFTDFGDYTFVFVGSVSIDSLRPLVEKWLGGLPTTGRHEMWKDVGPPDLTGVISKNVKKGKEPVSQQLVFFNGAATATGPEERIAAAAAAGILETRLLEQLREAMGATYGVQASSEVSSVPRKSYNSTISFSSRPELADSLWSAARRTIVALQTDGPTPDELAKFVAQQQRSTEVAVRTNDFWLNTLMQRVQVGEPLPTILDWSKRISALTPAVVRDAARKYFDTTRTARFTLLPETP